MHNVFVAWAISAVVIVVAIAWIGKKSEHKNYLAIFIDSRNRFSLARFQITMWTIIVISLFSGAFFARLFGRIPSPLEIEIPTQLLALMGISIGSTVTAEAIKAGKDIKDENNKYIARVGKGKAKFSQVYLAEEGEPGKKKEIDITKFQNYLFTLIVMISYVAAAIKFVAATKLKCFNALPGLTETMLILIGISHGGYLAGKLPNKKQNGDGNSSLLDSNGGPPVNKAPGGPGT